MAVVGTISKLPITVAGGATVRGELLTLPAVPTASASCLTAFADSVSKSTIIDLHGGLDLIASNQTLNVSTPVNFTMGISKILLVAKTGFLNDYSGDITVTGTSVDRDTGATTGSDTEVIALDGLSTDGSSAGTELATLWDFDDAYISSKWWSGAITLSTPASPAVNLTQLDIYTIAFEQFNDTDGVTVTSIDNTLYTSSTSSDFEIQAYKVAPKATPTANGCDVIPFGNMVLASPTLNLYYRLRRGVLGISIDGASGEGMFAQVKVGNSRTYTNWNSKVWYSMPLT